MSLICCYEGGSKLPLYVDMRGGSKLPSLIFRRAVLNPLIGLQKGVGFKNAPIGICEGGSKLPL